MSRAYTIDGAWICWAMRQPKKKKVPLVIDMRDPQHAGGGWLTVYRRMQEALRRAKLKASRTKPKK